jgi:hypothetical protein
MNSITRFALLVILTFCILPQAAMADQYQCLEPQLAQKAKAILEAKKFAIEFCSNCSAQETNIKRFNIAQVNLQKSDCGTEVFLKGKIVRGIKPPVFDGACTEKLDVYNPSTKLKLPLDKQVDLAYLYVWEPERKLFITLAEVLGLDTKNICIKALKLGR